MLQARDVFGLAGREARLRLGEAVGVQIAEGDARGGLEAAVPKEVARADADVEVDAPHVRAEEGQGDGGGGAAPDEVAHQFEDEEVVDEEGEFGVGGGAAGAGFLLGRRRWCVFGHV